VILDLGKILNVVNFRSKSFKKFFDKCFRVRRSKVNVFVKVSQKDIVDLKLSFVDRVLKLLDILAKAHVYIGALSI